MPKKKKKYSKKKKEYNIDKVFLFGSLMFAFVIILWVAVSLTQVDNKIISDDIETESPINKPSTEKSDEEVKTTVDQEVESSHNICEDGKCVSVKGSGSNDCEFDGDCKHNLCVELKCISVDIPGENECRIDADCACVCDSGTCCDGCYYRDSDHVCDSQFEKDFGCPWGTDCGSNTALRYKIRYCSGESDMCNGEISDWGEWSVFEECHDRQLCIDGVPKCKYSPKCR